MGHEASVISSARMNELGEYAETAPVPLWVAEQLHDNFEALGVYVRLSCAVTTEDPEKTRVTLPREWADALASQEAGWAQAMQLLIDIGAVTKVASYPNGSIRIQMETYPPTVREEIESYRRPNGKLVVSFS